jgi:hypothetical protein
MTMIAVCGLKRTGKDTVANYLSSVYNLEHVKISKPLKSSIQILFQFSDQQVNGNEKDVIDTRWGITPRDAMNFFGTEIFQYKIQELLTQKQFKRRFWIHSFMETLCSTRNYVVSDLRFYHEYQALKSKYGERLYVVKLQSDVNITCQQHASETDFRRVPESTLLINNEVTKLRDLYDQCDVYMKLIKN